MDGLTVINPSTYEKINFSNKNVKRDNMGNCKFLFDCNSCAS